MKPGMFDGALPRGWRRPRSLVAAAAIVFLLAAGAAVYVLRGPTPPVVLTGLLTSDGWLVTFHFGEGAAEIEYKLPSSERFERVPEPLGGRPPAETWTYLRGLRGRVPLLIRYKGLLGLRRGPYEVVFDTQEQAVRSVKGLLELSPKWVGFSERWGRRVCHFATLVSYKYALREIRYGVDAQPHKRLSFMPRDYSAIDNVDESRIDLPDDAKLVTVELVFLDGSRSEVKSFPVPFAGKARGAPPADPCFIEDGGREVLVPIRADDPERVDLVDLFWQARAAAEKLQPSPGLVEISALRVVRGTVDTTGTSAAEYRFRYEGRNPSRPACEDEVIVGITVLVGAGTLKARESDGTTRRKDYRERQPRGDGELIVPCSSTKAWAAAVRSGVPENAMATFAYGQPHLEGPGRAWEVYVKGPPAFEREIDPGTCEVVSTRMKR